MRAWLVAVLALPVVGCMMGSASYTPINTPPSPANNSSTDAGASLPTDAGTSGGQTSGQTAFQISFYAWASSTANGNCAQCHGVDVTPLFAAPDVRASYTAAKAYVDFKTPASSLLVTFAGNGHCGVPSCTGNSAAALAALAPWIAAESGAPVNPGPTRTPVGDLEALMIINADLSTRDPASQPYQRYFTLEAWGNMSVTPPVNADTERAALIKMINLLSTGPQIVQPGAVDTDRFIYRIDTRSVNWTASAWASIKATDPYFAPAAFPSAFATAATQTLRADWFVSNIPNSNVNAYFAFLGINSDDPTIDAMNGVNRFADMATGAPATFRAGLPLSNTEAHNRILSWHATNTFGIGAGGSGHLFKSYNFDSDVGTQDIFSHPYMPSTNNPNPPGPYDFDYADSDNLFTLPNGLFGYYTVIGEAKGQVMNAGNAGAPFPGPTFCLQCHDTKTNLIPLVDRMNAALHSDPSGTFSPSLLALLEGMYDNTSITAKMSAAGATYAQAYAQLKLPIVESVGIATECTNIVTNNYAVILSVASAAAEMGVSTSQLVEAIQKSSALSLPLASLMTEDASGNLNGVIRRDTWEASYAAVRDALYPQLPRAP